MNKQTSLILHMHPLASYCWKVLMALYENETKFRVVQIDGAPSNNKAFTELWPIAKMPLLQDDNLIVAETSIIIDHLQAHHSGSVILIPQDGEAAREVRFWDRFFDLYVHTPMGKFVTDRLRTENTKDPIGVNEARATLDTAYGILDRQFTGRRWAAGNDFSMADCSAFPALFYADAVHSYRASYPALSAYFERLVARPSAQKIILEAQPWLQHFPFVEALETRFLVTAVAGDA